MGEMFSCSYTFVHVGYSYNESIYWFKKKIYIVYIYIYEVWIKLEEIWKCIRALQHLTKTGKEWKKEKENKKLVLSLSSVPSLLAISSLWHSGCCVFVWDMDLDARSVTAHSTHSSVVGLLLLDVEQIDLGVDYLRAYFITFDWLLSTSHSYFSPSICISLTHTHIQLPLCRMQLKEAPGSCSSRLCLQVWLHCSRSAV